MNIFSAFNFGKIIKIVLPGFFALIGFILLIDAYCKSVLNSDAVLSVIKHHDALTVFISIPLTLGLGMTCNTIFFVYISEHWFSKWFRDKHPEANNFKIYLFKQFKLDIITNLNFSREIEAGLIEHSNAAGLILRNIDLEHFYFLQESYWSYFEYHVNMFLSITVCAIALPIWTTVHNLTNGLKPSIIWWSLGLYIMIVWMFLWITYKAAQVNYYKFQIKQLSYFATILNSCDES